MKVIIKNKIFTFLKGYQKDDKYRAAFNNLAKKVFGISFEEWYQGGYWNEKYVPYTIFAGERAVANVSANIMDFNVFGEMQRFIQIGTVMTDEEYRNQGLSRFLIEKVLKDWEQKCDFIYLYANKSSLNIYPKFGFSCVKEHEYFKHTEKCTSHDNVEKLNMDLQSNRDLFYDYAKNAKSFGKLALQENADLVMFYCISFMKENVYYLKSLDVIAVAKFDNNQLHLFDVFAKVNVDLEKILLVLNKPGTKEILLGFTPKDTRSYEIREVLGDDVLYIQNNKAKLFVENKVMFPLLSHA